MNQIRRNRVSLHLAPPLLAEIDRIAVTERRERADVVRLLIRMGTRYYGRRRSLLCDGPLCARKECRHGADIAIATGNLFEFPIADGSTTRGE